MSLSVKKYIATQAATASQTITVGTLQDPITLPRGFDHADVLVEEISNATTLGFTTTGSQLNVYQAESGTAVSLADGAVDQTQTNIAVGFTGLFSDPNCCAGRFGVFTAINRTGAGQDQQILSVPGRRVTLTLVRDSTSGTGTYRVSVWVYWNAATDVQTSTVTSSAA